ncbi:MAG: iron ABC transporter permease, partial [Phycisphaeraceae bacterium]
LGVMIAWAGWLPWAMQINTAGAALGGAVLTMLVVYLLAQKRGRIDPVGLLLVGVIVNAINGAAIMAINYINPHGIRGDMMRWMMGYLDDNVPLQTITIVGSITAAGGLIAMMLGRSMDVATFGDSESHSLGLRTGRLRFLLFLVASVLTAGAVMLAGPIGFVGLICPHIVRLMLGPGHRTLVLGAAMAGGIVVVGADTGIKYVSTIANVGLMPIGVLTALIGGPVFLLLLRSQLGRGLS